jgi:hypothetical protein
MAVYQPGLSTNNGVGCLSADLNQSVSIGPGGLQIRTGLLFGPDITGTIDVDGFTTTNPNGFQFNSPLDMNNNVIVSADPVSGGNISIGSEQILMVDGNDPQVTQCSIRGSRIAFQQTQFPNRTLTLDPDGSQFTNGGFTTDFSGGVITVSAPGQTTAMMATNGFTATQSGTGGQANPSLQLINTNAVGSVSMEVYKNKPTAVTVGDVLFNSSVYGKDAFGQKQEYTRISHTIRDGAGGQEDGSIEFGAFVNGSFNNFLQINGNQNEVNCLKPFDLTGNPILTTSGSMEITTVGSSGGGDITISGKSSSIMTLSSTQINLNAPDNNINLNAGFDVNIQGGEAINILSTSGSSLGITLTAATNVDITATGDNLSLTAGSAILLDSPFIEFQNINTTVSSGQHNVSITSTTNGLSSQTFLKMSLNGNDIWIPYFTSDPSL